MANNYFLEYSELLSDISNRLLQIQLKYNSLIRDINSDMKKGLLSNIDGERLLIQRMDRYMSGENPKYILSKEDTDYVREYAEVDRNGLMLASFLRRDLLDKIDKMKNIYNSVRIFGYYESLDPFVLRNTLKKEIVAYYKEQLDKVNSYINSLETSMREAVYRSTNYNKAISDRNRLNDCLAATVNIEAIDDEDLVRLICQFYKVRREYYDWFLKMKVKESYEVGSVYYEHCDLLDNVHTSTNEYITQQTVISDFSIKLGSLSSDLLQVLEDLSSFAIEPDKVPKKGLFRKEEPNNIEELRNMFITLVTFSGIKTYIEDTYNNDDGINLSLVFNKYFYEKYGEDTTFVSGVTFVNDLRDEVVAYYKGKINKIKAYISDVNRQINSTKKGLCGNIETCISQAKLQRDIRELYPARRSELQLPGFTQEELDRMYQSLSELISNGFSFGCEEDILFLGKV